MKEGGAMTIKDLLPWNRRKREVEVGYEGHDPFHALRSDLDRAFGAFWRSFNLPVANDKRNGDGSPALPRTDMRETDHEVEVVAELPGMDAKDVEVSVAAGVVVIRGQKTAERETEKEGYIRRERSFGRVERVIALPDGVDLDSAKATFKNGVLSITLAKTPEAQAAVKRIAVRRA
jgi:HSP20 family protein